tara:strand:- start:1054 stop:1983 length:930 start_codon:yes stop_codon:yes gene_type:complete
MRTNNVLALVACLSVAVATVASASEVDLGLRHMEYQDLIRQIALTQNEYGDPALEVDLVLKRTEDGSRRVDIHDERLPADFAVTVFEVGYGDVISVSEGYALPNSWPVPLIHSGTAARMVLIAVSTPEADKDTAFVSMVQGLFVPHDVRFGVSFIAYSYRGEESADATFGDVDMMIEMKTRPSAENAEVVNSMLERGITVEEIDGEVYAICSASGPVTEYNKVAHLSWVRAMIQLCEYFAMDVEPPAYEADRFFDLVGDEITVFVLARTSRKIVEADQHFGADDIDAYPCDDHERGLRDCAEEVQLPAE